MIRTISLVAAALGAVLALAACEGKAGSHSTSHAASPVAGPSSSASCVDQEVTWRDGGGVADIKAVGAALIHDSSAAGKAARSGLAADMMPELDTAAAGLLAAVQTAQGDPPPACATKVRTDWETGLADLARSGKSQQEAVQAVSNGDIRTADNDILAAKAAMVSGTNAVAAAARGIP